MMFSEIVSLEAASEEATSLVTSSIAVFSSFINIDE